MRIAYADPPYMGQGYRYPEKQEVNHLELIERLVNNFDAWALSCSTPSLRYLLPLCPDKVRVGAWVKPFCSFKKGVNPAYAWESVIFIPSGRKSRSGERVPTVRDWVSANITLQKGLVGAKPPEFCFWLFELLGMIPDDDFEDLFPGTGIVTQSWFIWKEYKEWLFKT